ncbi:non-SMC mitotic condensation complex subunit 1 [Mucor mucedo]|uniref:non-SMC mitotic condensation complex subunit 1 n=1 Tax=Mucor mucedo TaxID=29922 RepID=UPI0022203124|nr:non-SMC mitotic condensation complex subunit 1 [Mucor mucedo]KAI7890796.1 non-SMC mitotic condensation complex subunit 1 [Mucor mucedo]
MSNLQSEHIHQAQHTNPLKPRNNVFTCLACQVAFPSTDRQRAHYRTDWHKYNLKRKIMNLPPFTAEVFAQKVLAQQAKGKEEEERQGLVYECTICSHKKEITLFSDTEEDITDTESVISAVDHLHLNQDHCLFCNIVHSDFESNLKHMTLAHGFFLPDVEYLEDAPGLVLYLAEKIQDCICLYCNDRGKEYKTQNAVRKHMLDKGHCKMAYDESENPEDLLRFYNFGTMSEQDFEAATVDTVSNEEDELVLASGERLGHRRFMRYYKQKVRRPSQEEEADPLSITQGEETGEVIEPRNRKERRSKLAITNGTQLNGDMLRRLPEVVQVQQQHWQRQSSKKSNLIATTRLHFVLTDELLKIQGNASDYYIPNEIDIAGKSDHDLARFLNAFRVEIKSTKDDLDQNEKDTFNNHRNYLELYSYSVHWFLLLVEDNTTTSKMVVRRAKNSTNDLKTFDWSTQKLKVFDLASWLLDLKLSKIWTLTPDRVHFVTLFTKPAYQLFENPAHAKSSQIKERIFRILSLCIKNYDHLHVAQTTIMQNLQYWEHSAEPMAELLIYMVEKENYNQLADEILREISNREFKDTTTKEVKDSPNPKTFATFLQKLADLSPKTILKNLGVLINQLDSDSYMMRTAIVDILGNMIIELSRTSQDNPNQVDQINDFFDILEHRMLDPTAYVRQKVLQVYLRLFE